MTLLSNAICYGTYGHRFIVAKMLCVGSANGLGAACKGDSGGSLNINGKLLGIVSFGLGCRGYANVFTNVAAYREWIHTYLMN